MAFRADLPYLDRRCHVDGLESEFFHSLWVRDVLIWVSCMVIPSVLDVAKETKEISLLIRPSASRPIWTFGLVDVWTFADRRYAAMRMLCGKLHGPVSPRTLAHLAKYVAILPSSVSLN